MNLKTIPLVLVNEKDVRYYFLSNCKDFNEAKIESRWKDYFAEFALRKVNISSKILKQMGIPARLNGLFKKPWNEISDIVNDINLQDLYKQLFEIQDLKVLNWIQFYFWIAINYGEIKHYESSIENEKKKVINCTVFRFSYDDIEVKMNIFMGEDAKFTIKVTIETNQDIKENIILNINPSRRNSELYLYTYQKEINNSWIKGDIICDLGGIVQYGEGHPKYTFTSLKLLFEENLSFLYDEEGFYLVENKDENHEYIIYNSRKTCVYEGIKHFFKQTTIKNLLNRQKIQIFKRMDKRIPSDFESFEETISMEEFVVSRYRL